MTTTVTLLDEDGDGVIVETDGESLWLYVRLGNTTLGQVILPQYVEPLASAIVALARKLRITSEEQAAEERRHAERSAS